MTQYPQIQIFVAVPARLASTRLPDKPLADIGGATMARRVAARAVALCARLEADGLCARARALVATDDARVCDEARAAGAEGYLTDPVLPSGTDRIHAALLSHAAARPDEAPRPGDLVVNVQGDEPFFSIDDVLALARDMALHPAAPMGTLAFARRGFDAFLRPSVVKVVVDARGEALLFSRAPIPWPRALLGAGGLDWLASLATGGAPGAGDDAGPEFLHHLGVYAFRYEALGAFARALPPSRLEALEGLEQMRAVEAGWRVRVVRAHEEPFGIDTPGDLERARARVARGD